MKVYRSHYKNLQLRVGGGRHPVMFIDGQYATDDPELIKILDVAVAQNVIQAGIEYTESGQVVSTPTPEALGINPMLLNPENSVRNLGVKLANAGVQKPPADVGGFEGDLAIEKAP